MNELNAGRSERFKEEHCKLRVLPKKRLDACTRFDQSVSRFSTINLDGPVYSVPSRLKNEPVKVLQFSSKIEVWSGTTRIEIIPRAIGKKVNINYRHIIGSLIRKPGAFENYKYREELFPTSHFREAYDNLLVHVPAKAVKEYLHILQLAATYNESEVDLALIEILNSGAKVSQYAVTEMITRPVRNSRIDVIVDVVSLKSYDHLISKEDRHGA